MGKGKRKGKKKEKKKEKKKGRRKEYGLRNVGCTDASTDALTLR